MVGTPAFRRVALLLLAVLVAVGWLLDNQLDFKKRLILSIGRTQPEKTSTSADWATGADEVGKSNANVVKTYERLTSTEFPSIESRWKSARSTASSVTDDWTTVVDEAKHSDKLTITGVPSIESRVKQTDSLSKMSENPTQALPKSQFTKTEAEIRKQISTELPTKSHILENPTEALRKLQITKTEKNKQKANTKFPTPTQIVKNTTELSRKSQSSKTDEDSRVCPMFSLTPTRMPKYGKCKPHQPTEESCQLAQNYYYLDPKLTKCKQSSEEDICKMRKTRSLQISCHATLCEQGQRDAFVVRSLDPQTGSVTVAATFRTVKELEDGLTKVIEENRGNKFNFVFLNCKKRGGGKVTQLLPTEPRLTIAEQPTERRAENLINVNVLLLDSLSRAHFYRSLPKTVATFSKWAKGDSPSAEIFDFELFQAVHGHTAENTHALFTGKLIPFAMKDKRHSVEPEVLFERFKRAGYQTMWQEDLCWKGIWGLMTDLTANSWEDLGETLTASFIDNTGKGSGDG